MPADSRAERDPIPNHAFFDTRYGPMAIKGLLPLCTATGWLRLDLPEPSPANIRS